MRKQTGPNGALPAWQRIMEPHTSHPLGGRPLVILPTEGGGRIIGRSSDGNIWAGTISATAASSVRPVGHTTAWRSLAAPATFPDVSAVVMPDNTVQLFATGVDGVVQTQRETSTGFPGTWTPISGVTASGRPSAVMAPDGTLQIVVRANDGYVYYTGQAAPGSPAFNPWQEITNYSEQSSTDPTALAVPESNTWVIAYRTDLEVPRLRRHQPSAPGSAATSTSGGTFVDIPMTPPAP